MTDIIGLPTIDTNTTSSNLVEPQKVESFVEVLPPTQDELDLYSRIEGITLNRVVSDGMVHFVLQDANGVVFGQTTKATPYKEDLNYETFGSVYVKKLFLMLNAIKVIKLDDKRQALISAYMLSSFIESSPKNVVNENNLFELFKHITNVAKVKFNLGDEPEVQDIDDGDIKTSITV